MSKTSKFCTWSTVTAVTTEQELAALSTAEELRDQIRVRTHKYGMSATDIGVLIGTDKAADAVARLREELKLVVAKELPPPLKPVCPTMRAPLAPTAAATQLDMAGALEMHRLYAEVLAMCDRGEFVASRNRPRQQQQQRQPPRQRRRLQPQLDPPLREQPSAQARAMAGVSFMEEEVRWKCLEPDWSEDYDCAVIYYYDVEMAREANATEGEMRQLLLQHSAVQMSTITEGKGWIDAG